MCFDIDCKIIFSIFINTHFYLLLQILHNFLHPIRLLTQLFEKCNIPKNQYNAQNIKRSLSYRFHTFVNNDEKMYGAYNYFTIKPTSVISSPLTYIYINNK